MNDQNSVRSIAILQPSERLEYASLEETKHCYTLTFSNLFLSVNFSNGFQTKSILVRIYNLVLLEHICKLLLAMGENSEMLEFVIPLLNHFELPQLRSEVEAVLRNKKTRQIFQTMKYHFGQSYGTLIKLTQGVC